MSGTKFGGLTMYCVDTMDAVIRCGHMYILTSN